MGRKKNFDIFFLFFLPFLISCFKNTDYLDPSKPIVDIVEYYKIYQLPLKYEKKLSNCNAKILIYSFIGNNDLYENIYNSIFEGIEILNEYLNFGNEMYQKKELKWNIYVVFNDPNIRNYKYKFRKNKDNDFIQYRNILRIDRKKENWEKEVCLLTSHYIHELSHYFFDKKKGCKRYSWFEEGFAVHLEYIIRAKFKEIKTRREKQYERVKKDEKLLDEVWKYKAGYLVLKKDIKVRLMKMLFIPNKRIKKYINDFWNHFDDLYFLSAAIVMTMEQHYGKEKFKEILKMYENGIENKKLKKMAEEAIFKLWK